MLGFPGQRKRRRAASIGAAFGREGVAVARVVTRGRDRPPQLTACAWLAAAEPEAQVERLEGWLERNHGRQDTVVGVLAPGEYQVLPIEAPPVPANEMRRAAAWRVRELIDFPVDQAVVDTFAPPQSTQRGTASVNVVVARQATVGGRIDQLRRAGLDLEVIDIPELAQRNISAHLPDGSGGHALLALDEGGGLITVYRDGEQYLARSLDTGYGALGAQGTGGSDALVLEVQRSLDYFESALAQPPLGALYIYPPVTQVERLAQDMEANLVNVECRAIALGDILTTVSEPEHADATVLHAVGAALRQATVEP